MALTRAQWMDVFLEAGYAAFVSSKFFILITDFVIAHNRDPNTLLPVEASMETGDCWYNAYGYTTVDIDHLPQKVWQNFSPVFRPVVVIDLNAGHGMPPPEKKRRCGRGHTMNRGDTRCLVCLAVWSEG